MVFELRGYQREAKDEATRQLKEHDKLGIVLPTACGKTEIFIAIAQDYLSQNPNRSVLVLSHLSILTEQTKDRFNLRCPSLKVGVLQGKTMPSCFDQVVISTMQSSKVERKIKQMKDRMIRPVGLIIVDEAHFIYTDSYEKALGYFPDAKLIGCTATPYRSNEVMINYFDKLAFTRSMGDLITEGYLVQPELHEIVEKSKEIEDICANVINIYKDREIGKNAIVFMRTIEDAKLIRNMFVSQGIACEAITGKTGDRERARVFRDFGAGTIKVLSTVNVLTAGFDCPRIESVFMPYGTKSATQYLQRVGRGLRLCPEIHKSSCRIYAFGSAPSISKRHFKKIQDQALAFGGKPRELKTYTQDLEYAAFETPEKYEWTKQVCEAINHMQRVGMTNIARLLNEKKFPDRFMGDVSNLLNRLPSRGNRLPGGEDKATDKQISMLRRNGFEREFCETITKNEASNMIATIMNSAPDGEWVIKQGPHRGKHVSHLPWKYKEYVKRHYPNSGMAKLILKWEQRNDRAVTIHRKVV